MNVIAWLCVAASILGGILIFAFSPGRNAIYLVFSLSLLVGLTVAWAMRRRRDDKRLQR